MKSRTRFRIGLAAPEFDELRTLGYEIHQFQPWHYRVSNSDYKTRVDVWPTTMKLWKVDSGFTATYKDGELARKIREIFSREEI